jgi:hypothetical protein
MADLFFLLSSNGHLPQECPKPDCNGMLWAASTEPLSSLSATIREMLRFLSLCTKFFYILFFVLLFKFIFIIGLFYFGGTRVLNLLGKYSSPFCISYLSDRVSCDFSIINLGLWSSYLCLPRIRDDRHVPPHLAYLLRWALLTFCPGWSWTVILLISASEQLGSQVCTSMPGYLLINFNW